MCLNNFVTSVALSEVCTVLSAILVRLEFIVKFACVIDSQFVVSDTVGWLSGGYLACIKLAAALLIAFFLQTCDGGPTIFPPSYVKKPSLCVYL